MGSAVRLVFPLVKRRVLDDADVDMARGWYWEGMTMLSGSSTFVIAKG